MPTLVKELHTVNGVIEIAREMNIKSIIITHIEEDWGKSYDDYLELQNQYSNVKFAFDGMRVEV